MRKHGVPQQFIAVSLLRYVSWTRIETFFQCNYTWEEIFNLVPHGDGFLVMCLSKVNIEREKVGQPRDWRNGR